MKFGVAWKRICKSTIINLVLRFYDVFSAAVKVDGIDVCTVTQASLRGCVAKTI